MASITFSDGQLPSMDHKLASGIFKFSGGINSQTVAAFVTSEWAQDPNFVEISLRKCDGDRKFGVAFKCRHGGTKEEFDRFFDQCVGKLTRVFRTDFVGWDISSCTQIIK